MSSSADLVALRDVDLVYGSGDDALLAVQGLDFSIRPGEFVAVVGPSGCGKSSLMKLVTGLLPATRGSIEVDGKRVTAPVPGVGMAFQNATLLPWRTTIENVLLPFEIVAPHKHRLRRHRDDYVAKAQALLRSVGLGDFGAKFPWQLSGGMQQRANLCRALVHEPRLLMLDEPFGALDAFTRETLWSVMQNLWLARGFTAVLVTHDLREAAFLSDTVHVMSSRPGRIIHTQQVDIPRPRTLATLFEPRFVEIVHAMRQRIHVEAES